MGSEPQNPSGTNHDKTVEKAKVTSGGAGEGDSCYRDFRPEPTGFAQHLKPVKKWEDQHDVQCERLQLQNDEQRTRIQELEEKIKLRKKYAMPMFVVMCIQLAIVNIAFFLAGFEILEFDAAQLEVFTAATMADIFGIVFVIVRYIFKQDE